MPGLIRAFIRRPLLASALAAGILVALILVVAPLSLRSTTIGIFAWDATCAWFVVGTLAVMRGRDPPSIRAYAATQDEGQGVIIGLVLVASAASLVAIGLELSLAKDARGLEKVARVAFTFGTVALSWFMVQLIFALHYAHEYYGPPDQPGDRLEQGGLDFPGDDDPDYWDFVHFAVVIGVAAQTADIEFTSRTLRRIGTIQSIIAFVYNTVVLALTINLLADLL